MVNIRKILFTMSLLLVVLTSLVACGGKVSIEEESLVNNFLGREYAQLYYSEEEQAKIQEERQALDGIINLENYYYFYQESLTPDFYERMLANRHIPNPQTLEQDFDYSEVTDLVLNKKGNTIQASFSVDGYKAAEVVETKEFKADFKLKKVNDTVLIDNIDGDLAWN